MWSAVNCAGVGGANAIASKHADNARRSNARKSGEWRQDGKRTCGMNLILDGAISFSTADPHQRNGLLTEWLISNNRGSVAASRGCLEPHAADSSQPPPGPAAPSTASTSCLPMVWRRCQGAIAGLAGPRPDAISCPARQPKRRRGRIAAGKTLDERLRRPPCQHAISVRLRLRTRA